MLMLAIYAAILTLAVFVAVGYYLVVRSMRIAAREQRLANGEPEKGLSLRQRASRYVGPVRPEMALLNPYARVGVEFFGSLCGFPGIGWLISTRVVVGLLLFCIGPVFTWAIYPLYLGASNEVTAGPYVTLRYLPVMAVISAGMLAVSQVRAARARSHEEADA